MKEGGIGFIAGYLEHLDFVDHILHTNFGNCLRINVSEISPTLSSLLEF